MHCFKTKRFTTLNHDRRVKSKLKDSIKIFKINKKLSKRLNIQIFKTAVMYDNLNIVKIF